MVIGTLCQPIWNKCVPPRFPTFAFPRTTTHPPSPSRLYLKSKLSHGGTAPPEARLYSGMAGSLLCPLGIFLFSATSLARIHWAVPMVMSVPFGIGIVWCFQSVFTFLVE